MTLTYTKAVVMWLIMFPFLFVFNVIKATVDFIVWVFDLPVNVWDHCLKISQGPTKPVKNGDNV